MAQTSVCVVSKNDPSGNERLADTQTEVCATAIWNVAAVEHTTIASKNKDVYLLLFCYASDLLKSGDKSPHSKLLFSSDLLNKMMIGVKIR